MSNLEKLTELASIYNAKNDFKVGDIVQWKPGMMTRKYPEVGDCAIVVDIVPGRVDTTENNGSSYYMEDCSLSLGVIDQYGDFVVCVNNPNRFELAKL